MIVLEEGDRDMQPWVRVEITPGRWPWQWWYEVHYYDPRNRLHDQPFPCWVHDWEKDGDGFGLWFVMKRAMEILQDVWHERHIQEKLYHDKPAHH